jgi:hypothetical protein
MQADQDNLQLSYGGNSVFSEFFGRLPKSRHRADDDLSHETFNLPDAYKGKNQHLEDVLDFMIRKEDEFYTSKLLPWFYTDDIHVEWEIFRFNRTLMDVEPEQGIPRLVTAETERRTDNLLRRGLAFMIEHGFMTTERGRKHFMMNLQQITDAVHTTAHFGVMHALLTSEHHYKTWRHEHDRLAKRPRNLMKHERDTWAIVQKSHKGLHILDADMKHEMKRNGVTPNIWVFPPKMSIYLDMVPTEATNYQNRGQLALGNLEEDRTSKGIRWRGTEVFEAESFDIDFDYNDTDLLRRVSQCGEFFVVPWGTRSIKVFSADHDALKEITHSEASEKALNGSNDALSSLMPARHGRSEHMRLSNVIIEKIGEIKKKLDAAIVKMMNKETPKQFKDKPKATRKKYNAANGDVAHGLNPNPDRTVAGPPAARYNDDLAMLLALHQRISDTIRLGQSTYDLLQRMNGPTGGVNAFIDAGWRTAPAVNGAGRAFNVPNAGVQNTLAPAGYLGAVAAAPRTVADCITACLGTVANRAAVVTDLTLDNLVLTFVQFNRNLHYVAEFLVGEIEHERDVVLRTDTVQLINATGQIDEDRTDAIRRSLKRLSTYWAIIEVLRLSCERGLPHDVLVFRPFQSYRMSSAVLAAGGEDLGSTFHGHHDFQLSDDIIRKVHLGHYTHYSKSVIKQPKRFSVAEDCFAQGYVSGEGVEFFSEDDLVDEMDRVGEPDLRKSLISWIVPCGSMDDRVAIDMTGQFGTDYSAYNHAEDEEHFEDASILKAMLKRCGLNPRSVHHEFLGQPPDNTVCFRGLQYDQVRADIDARRGNATVAFKIKGQADFVCTSLGHGHWKGLTFAGCMGVREGSMMTAGDFNQPKIGDRA